VSEGQVVKRKKKKTTKRTKELQELRKIVDNTESVPDTWVATDKKEPGDAWQDARIRELAYGVANDLVAGLLTHIEGVLETRCTLDAENYRVDMNSMFQRHNDTSTRLTGIEERLIDAERRITVIQNILVRHGLARRVMPV
jgi:hypothetical protein